MSPTKRIIIFSALGLLAIGAGVAYYLYNKGPVDVKNASGIKVVATELYQTFSQDSLLAKNKYTNKIVEVSGTVTKISKNQDNNEVILLKTNELDAFINCTMEGPAGNIRVSDNVIIKGICNGILSDFGILGDISLARCYVTK